MSEVYKTEENLKSAFAGESQANRRYLMFADKAQKEGYPQIARMFRVQLKLRRSTPAIISRPWTEWVRREIT